MEELQRELDVTAPFRVANKKVRATNAAVIPFDVCHGNCGCTVSIILQVLKPTGVLKLFNYLAIVNSLLVALSTLASSDLYLEVFADCLTHCHMRQFCCGFHQLVRALEKQATTTANKVVHGGNVVDEVHVVGEGFFVIQKACVVALYI